jgi:hypothetical protein
MGSVDHFRDRRPTFELSESENRLSGALKWKTNGFARRSLGSRPRELRRAFAARQTVRLDPASSEHLLASPQRAI